MTQIPNTLYRLVRAEDWQAAAASGVYRGAEHDARDGFVHLSTAAQAEDTAERHYSGVPDLLLLTLDARRLDGEIRFEPSSGGELFPHLYGTIPVEAVLEVQRIPLDPEGGFRFPFLG